MKAIVWFLPRSASTSYALWLAQQTNSEYVGEIFDNRWCNDESRKRAIQLDDVVIKLNPEQYINFQEEVDSIIDQFELHAVEPRNYIESYTSWLLPTTIMKHKSGRDQFWNIHWKDHGGPSTPEEMKDNYQGHRIDTNDALDEITRYSEIVDMWIEQTQRFEINKIIKQKDIPDLIGNYGKIWSGVNEKISYMNQPDVLLPNIRKHGAHRWQKIERILA